MSRWGLTALGLLLPPLLAGCYAGAAAVAIGILSSSSGGGGTVNHPPDTPLIETTSRADQGRVLVDYFLRDDDGGPLDVTVEWQPEDGSASYAPATEFQEPLVDGQGNWVQSQGREGLLTEPNKGRPAIFVWDARLDLERALGKPMARVRLRLAAQEGTRPGEAGFSDPFIAGNEPPKVLSIEPEAASGVIPVAVTVADSTADLVRFKATYRLGDATRCMTLASEEGEQAGCVTSAFFTSPLNAIE